MISAIRDTELNILAAPLPGVYVIKPERHTDARGFFVETYNKKALAEGGIQATFVQDNISASERIGTLRGLHYQTHPCAQAKLASVLQGSVLDVVVDLRRSSPCFGQHFSIELTAEEGNQLFIPAGFAHGFITRAENTIFAYKVSNYYSSKHDAGVHFADPSLNISWGMPAAQIFVSERDEALPAFDPATAYFA